MAGCGRVDGRSAVSTRNSDEDDGVVFGSDDFGSTRVAPILLSLLLTRSFFFLYPLSLLAWVCGGWPPGGGRARGRTWATRAGAFIAEAWPGMERAAGDGQGARGGL